MNVQSSLKLSEKKSLLCFATHCEVLMQLYTVCVKFSVIIVNSLVKHLSEEFTWWNTLISSSGDGELLRSFNELYACVLVCKAIVNSQGLCECVNFPQGEKQCPWDRLCCARKWRGAWRLGLWVWQFPCLKSKLIYTRSPTHSPSNTRATYSG